VCCLFIRRPGETTGDRQTDVEQVDPGRVETRTKVAAKPGQAVLRIASIDGLRLGDKVRISSGESEDHGIIQDFRGDTIVLARPVEHHHPATARILSQGASLRTPRRNAMINELFQLLDTDGNQYLNRSELLVLAKLDGFDGTDEEWNKEYSKFARSHFHKERNLGCNRWQFTSLVNDRDAFYITDDEIRRYIDDVHQFLNTLTRVDIGKPRR